LGAIIITGDNKIMNNTKPFWPITTNRFVGFVDIMGFKDMVMRSSHVQIYEMMKKIEKSISLSKSGLITKRKDYVKITTYSDSIMLFSKNNTYFSFDNLVTAISSLTNDLFSEGIPHKGAIAFGKMTLDEENSIYFGQPLIDSFLLQDELHFYGIIVHGSVEKEMLTKMRRTPFIVKYNCPLKNGKSNHYTIHPMHIDHMSANDYNYKRNYDKIISSLNSMRFGTSGHLRRYIDNTEEYFHHIVDNKL